MTQLAYLDTSAMAKLLKREDESDALAAALGDWSEALVSSVLLEPELRRVAVRAGLSQADCEIVLSAVTLIDLDESIRRRTGYVGSPELRASDAVHLATALEIGDDLGASLRTMSGSSMLR